MEPSSCGEEARRVEFSSEKDEQLGGVGKIRRRTNAVIGDEYRSDRDDPNDTEKGDEAAARIVDDDVVISTFVAEPVENGRRDGFVANSIAAE